jgi:ubiquinone/menaquinone biosynthesis C-methylase UbiE
MAGESALFSDGASYERFIGPWTRAVGAVFLDWIAAAPGKRWLEIGCGTGLFTEMLVDTAQPAEAIAIDPSAAQIREATTKAVAKRVDFRIADAQALPFGNQEFDLAVSALVINFIPDPSRAMAELKRVVRPGGLIAGYVWDFLGDLSITRHVQTPLRQFNPNLPKVTGADVSRMEPLVSLFTGAGLENVTSRPIEVEVTYPSFDVYWQRYMDNPSPQSAYIKALSAADFAKLQETVRSGMPIRDDGTIAFAARANAVKGFIAH